MGELRKYAAANVPRSFAPLDRSLVPSLKQLCESPEKYLGKVSIAVLNLICAGGLPHSENIDIERYFDWMEEAAHVADFNVRRHLYRFNASPRTYHISLGYFCCYHLLQTLQEEFGVRYNPARVRDPKFQDPKCHDPDFSDSRDLFIHGIIDGPGGTCSSMPVLYTAVGRILGSPLKLVETRGHLFFRWDDPKGTRFGYPDVFNVEGTGEGIGSDSDDHYRKWPEPWTETDIAAGYYLKSLSPAEELAGFLATRAECLTCNHRIEEAHQAYTWASALVPTDPRYRALQKKLAGMLNFKIEYESWRMGEEKRRRKEIIERSIVPKNENAGVAQHGGGCKCAICSAKREPAIPPHGGSCQCALCVRARTEAGAHRQSLGNPSNCRFPLCKPVSPPAFGRVSSPQPFSAAMPRELP